MQISNKSGRGITFNNVVEGLSKTVRASGAMLSMVACQLARKQTGIGICICKIFHLHEKMANSHNAQTEILEMFDLDGKCVIDQSLCKDHFIPVAPIGNANGTTLQYVIPRSQCMISRNHSL